MLFRSPDEKTSDEMKGQVIFEEQSLHVEIAIVWREKASAGGRFLAGHAEVRGLLRRIFTDELRAMEMSEVDSSRQKALEEGNPKWFHAPGNVELFYVENGGELKRFEVEWGGNVLVWDGKQLRFGTVDPEHRESLSHARSSIVNWSSELSPKILKKALRILENVQGLDAAILERMRGILTPG